MHAIILVVAVIAAEPSKLDSFSFDGLTLGTSLEQFRRQRPEATVMKSATRHGKTEYVIGPEGVDYFASFDFLDGNLYCIEIAYDAAKIAKLGGRETMKKQAIAGFGPTRETNINGGTKLDWKTKTRKAYLWFPPPEFGDRGYLKVEDAELSSLYLERSFSAGRSNLGF